MRLKDWRNGPKTGQRRSINQNQSINEQVKAEELQVNIHNAKKKPHTSQCASCEV